MAGTGVELRMNILKNEANANILQKFSNHGWESEISREVEAGEYLIIDARKQNTSRKLALMYSSATDNRHYKLLESLGIDVIFINGELYKIESFAYGLNIPVEPLKNFLSFLVNWNKEIEPPKKPLIIGKQKRKVKHIQAENPLDLIWARLQQLSSVKISEALVKRRALEIGKVLEENVIKTKAEGIARSIQSATDYFDLNEKESMNKRVLGLYYGVLSFAFAEMLADPEGPTSLDELEEMTKSGHGMFTFHETGKGLEEFYVGVLKTGFLPNWLCFLGHDTSNYPAKKIKKAEELQGEEAVYHTAIIKLFASMPELNDLLEEVFDVPALWVTPSYDAEANHVHFSSTRVKGSSYIRLYSKSKSLTKEQLEEIGWPLSEIEAVNPSPNEIRFSSVFKARVDHDGHDFWHGVMPYHNSPYGSSPTLIMPKLARIYEYRVIAMVILYSVSIMVRYMPSAWRRVESGDWDHYYSLIKTSLNIFSRVIPQEFLESITGERIYTKQSGGL